MASRRRAAWNKPAPETKGVDRECDGLRSDHHALENLGEKGAPDRAGSMLQLIRELTGREERLIERLRVEAAKVQLIDEADPVTEQVCQGVRHQRLDLIGGEPPLGSR